MAVRTLRKAKQLGTVLYSSPSTSPPLLTFFPPVLLGVPSQILTPSTPGSGLHWRRLILSFYHPASGDRYMRRFSTIPSDQEVTLPEDQQPPTSNLIEPAHEDHLLQVLQEKKSRFVPVKAYFLCTSIDLRSLHAQNVFNVVIPPTSRATSYIVRRYYELKNDPQVVGIY